MSLRFYRRIALIPGLRLNASRGGLSLSIGHRGAWYTVGPHGHRRVALGLPGSGLFYTQSIPPGPPIRHHHRIAFAILVVAALVAIYWAAFSGGGADGWATLAKRAP